MNDFECGALATLMGALGKPFCDECGPSFATVTAPDAALIREHGAAGAK